MTLAAETELINNALDNGYNWSANNSIPNYVTTRQTVSSKIQSIITTLKILLKKKLQMLFILKLMRYMLIFNLELLVRKIELFLLS